MSSGGTSRGNINGYICNMCEPCTTSNRRVLENKTPCDSWQACQPALNEYCLPQIRSTTRCGRTSCVYMPLYANCTANYLWLQQFHSKAVSKWGKQLTWDLLAIGDHGERQVCDDRGHGTAACVTSPHPEGCRTAGGTLRQADAFKYTAG